MAKPSATLMTEEETELHLKQLFLVSASAIAGGVKSSPAATRAAGKIAAELKEEIAVLEGKIVRAKGAGAKAA